MEPGSHWHNVTKQELPRILLVFSSLPESLLESYQIRGTPKFRTSHWLVKELINTQKTCVWPWAVRGNFVAACESENEKKVHRLQPNCQVPPGENKTKLCYYVSVISLVLQEACVKQGVTFRRSARQREVTASPEMKYLLKMYIHPCKGLSWNLRSRQGSG